MSSKSSIPTGLQILLRDLDFLGQIARGQKVCITNRVIIDGDSWLGAFYRAWKGEDRTSTINKIEQIVNQTVDAINSHKDTDYLDILVNYFAYARNGIDALSFTYQSDPDMKSRINVQLKNIDLQLDQYRHLIKGYSNPGLNNDLKLTELSKEHKINLDETNESEDKKIRVSSESDLERLERLERRRRRKNKDSENYIGL